jgi:hypothetical protein
MSAIKKHFMPQFHKFTARVPRPNLRKYFIYTIVNNYLHAFKDYKRRESHGDYYTNSTE